MREVGSPEKTIKSNLVAKYRQDGYRVIEWPGPLDLPFDLAGYQPDLIAQKGDKSYIIEVKVTASRVPIDRYRELAEEIARHPGWRFVLVTGDDQLPAEPPTIDGGLPSWTQISIRAKQADELLRVGDPEPAFLFLWAVFESLLRKRATQVRVPVERFPTPALIKHLYSQGELSIPQFDQTMNLLECRNRAVHGLETVDLTEPARQVSQLVQDLLRSWGPYAPGA